jgi:eukaryotic-like serine/threonine-protein kinase
MRVLIAVIAGPHQGQVFTFTGHDTFLVGRSKRAHFRLPEKDEYFSRIHFLVEVNAPRCRLMDMKSTNGIYVNGKKVLTADLAHGDRIEAGQTVLQVSFADDEVKPVSEQPPADVSAPATVAYLPAQPLDGPAPPQAATTMPSLAGAPAIACRVCAAVAGRDLPAELPAHPWLLCQSCQDQVRALPQSIPGYQLIRELGRGGMGIVYLAVRRTDGLVVALKTIQPAGDVSSQEVQRFLREASILRELDHPGIVACRDLGAANGQLFFAMDFVRGADAGRLLKAQPGPWPIARAVYLACQVLATLEYAHSRGYVHRDIKPANLLVTPVEEGEEVKLVDFGLARLYQSSPLSGLTLEGQIGGTTPFMAPEQILNFRESKPPVDQYAAGATLYNLLTRHYVHDFPKSFQERMLKILQDDPVPIRRRRPEIPAPLADVIHRALARDEGERFASVAPFRKALLANLPAAS